MNDMKGMATTTAILLVIIVVIVVAGIGVGAYFATRPSAPTTTTIPTTTTTTTTIPTTTVAENLFVDNIDGTTYATKAELYQHLFTAPGHPAITVTLWGWSTALLSSVENKTGFDNAFPNIKIQYILYNSADVNTKLKLVTAAGVGAPTIAQIQYMDVPTFAAIGTLRPLDDLGAQAYANLFPDWVWQASSWHGKLVGVPWDIGPVVLYYREDIFKQYGLTVPTTFAQFENEGEALKAAQAAKGINPGDPGYIYYTSFSSNIPTSLEILVESYCGAIFNVAENGQITSNLDNAAAIYAAGLLQRMWNDKTASADQWWVGSEWLTGLDNGRYATLLLASWMGGNLEQSWCAPDGFGLWRVAPMPQWVEGVPTGASSGGTTFDITAQATDLQAAAAWEYLKWILLTENGAHEMFMESKSFPAMLPVENSPDVLSPDNYYGGQAWNQICAEAVSHVQPVKFTRDYDFFTTYASIAAGKIATGENAQAALQEAATLINKDILIRG